MVDFENEFDNLWSKYDKHSTFMSDKDKLKFLNYIENCVTFELNNITTKQQRQSQSTFKINYKEIFYEGINRYPMLGLLLCLQSFSSFILFYFEKLISKYVIITLYLTMLVGAGGNAGNQSAVLMIRNLSKIKTKSIRNNNQILNGFYRFIYDCKNILIKEIIVSFIISILMFFTGFIRVLIFNNQNSDINDENIGDILLTTTTISIALFIIVFFSIVIGCILPLVFYHCGFDPAHAGPSIQVIMNIF